MLEMLRKGKAIDQPWCII